MKRLLISIAALLFAAAPARAVVYPILGSVQIGTATAVIPALQTGTINISSGVIRSLTVSTLTISNLATIPSLTVTTMTVTSATITAATIPSSVLGVSSMTSTLPMSGRKITGLANGTASTDAFALGQLTMPSVQRFLSGSGTYTVPASPRLPTYIKVTMVGPGGGGGGGGISGTTGGSAGSGATTFSAGGASAGPGGGAINGLDGGTGGTNALTTSATILAIQALAGGQGAGATYITTSSSSNIALNGGIGGSTPLGGGGTGGLTNGTAHAGRANTGEGGGGGGNGATGTNNFTGGGGGGGGYIQFYVAVSSQAAYTYSIGTGGAGGNAGSGGSGGAAGATGGSGQVAVEEFYQ